MALSSSPPTPPHVALLPSAGMGHINPFCRLAISLIERGCTVSFIVSQPTVSTAESLAISSLLSSFPTTIHCINLPLVELDTSLFPPTNNPFFLRFEAIRQSAHLLPSLLSSTSPINALIIDIINASAFIPISKQLNLPCHLLFTSSASMLSLATYLPTHLANTKEEKVDDVSIPGFRTIPNSSIPPSLREPDKHLFGIQFLENSALLQKADGILINTFQEFEPEAISALNSGKIVSTMPPVFAIGPLSPLPSDKSLTIDWLDEQPDESVVYVSFGSLTAMSEEQIEEIGAGLEKSGQRYLWVIKTKRVDREEEMGYVKRVGERGLVVNGWVEQEEILRHRAVGGFVSHCGWNSLTEAAMAGTRVLGWPRIGDQRVNGGVVRGSGLGVWMEEWCWEEEGGVVSGDEIAKRVREMMEDEELRKTAAGVGEAARVAVGGGGSSAKVLEEFIARLG